MDNVIPFGIRFIVTKLEIQKKNIQLTVNGKIYAVVTKIAKIMLAGLSFFLTSLNPNILN